MNPKIQKLRAELEKNLGKIKTLDSRNAELKQQIQELEDIDIIGIVRAVGLSPEDLARLIRKNPDALSQNKEDMTDGT